ncbi:MULTISPECIES: carboxylesterase/lipase family protein [unclassified Amycolatopsis]|uniref:carboxylesterase/lipase family protein n=1 Tax=unclassified Amycolatopsis TaxID=2618356 RepID=UPI0021054001|nr:carboxylesterase family protein [Amycolatopsis sp. DSM 110486]
MTTFRRMFRAGLGVTAAAALLACLPGSASGEAAGPDLVQVHDGQLRGVVAGEHRTFAGIPYAAPPVGDRRWRVPAPVPHWHGVRAATAPGNRCPQPGSDPAGGPTVIGYEDCLYLNVTTPVMSGNPRLPVLVWLPGGGFVNGAGSDYDPSRLAVTGDVVVVTVNYRLGALGFLDEPALHDTWAGNYGLADQQAALRWVRENIQAFGGDAHNVTLAGQSAGAFSVCAQLAAPAAQGLFDKAIVQSGPCGNSFVSQPDAQRRGGRTAARLGCAAPADVAACLRAIPAADLIGLDTDDAFRATNRLRDMPWSPVAGSPALPRQPLDALRDGFAAGIPIIQGTNRDEMRPFVALDNDARGKPVTAAGYAAALGELFGPDTDRVLAEYPADRFSTPGIALATALTGRGAKLGACPAALADQAAARYAHVYAYEFAQDDGQHILDFPMGAAHSAELPYLFDGTFAGPPAAPPDAGQISLSHQLIGYWAAFARTGDPNADGAPRWPRYQPTTMPSFTAAGTQQIDFSTEHHCPFWQTVRR